MYSRGQGGRAAPLNPPEFASLRGRGVAHEAGLEHAADGGGGARGGRRERRRRARRAGLGRLPSVGGSAVTRAKRVLNVVH
jgi:hypothetical protein